MGFSRVSTRMITTSRQVTLNGMSRIQIYLFLNQVVSDSTFNQFTPLLPSAAVGTVSVRSLVESVRSLLYPLGGHFVLGRAVDVVMSERLLEVEVDSAEPGKKKRIYIPYDKLIIACGSVSATHGVKGLERCFQLKTIDDAQQIRRRIIGKLTKSAVGCAVSQVVAHREL